LTSQTIDFGPFRLDTDPDRLWRGSEEVALRAKSLSVLAYLARRPGRLVTKDELREQVWGAAHVSDTTLRVTVREIRAALGDDQTSS
jgi:serine/threonine-protein kinase